ncbi:hypothetical protein JYU34_008904, partial [Plutella xylostella]
LAYHLITHVSPTHSVVDSSRHKPTVDYGTRVVNSHFHSRRAPPASLGDPTSKAISHRIGLDTATERDNDITKGWIGLSNLKSTYQLPTKEIRCAMYTVSGLVHQSSKSMELSFGFDCTRRYSHYHNTLAKRTPRLVKPNIRLIGACKQSDICIVEYLSNSASPERRLRRHTRLVQPCCPLGNTP